MLEVKILGIGCPKCKKLEEIAREAAQEAHVEAQFEKVTDITAITAYPILGTPGLVINGEVVSSGRLPKKEEVIGWLKAAAQS